MSVEHKHKILEWGLEHHPSWFCRWWRDEAFEGDMIVLNKDGDFCINSHDLLRLIVALDPFLANSLKNVETMLNQRYSKTLSLKIHPTDWSMDLYINDETLTSAELHEFSETLQNDVYRKTGRHISLSSGWSFTRAPVRVVPYHAKIVSADSSSQDMSGSTTIEERFKRKFLCQSEAIKCSGIRLSVNFDLPPLFDFLDLKCPSYFPSSQTHIPPIELSIDPHPVLLLTKWRFVGININGNWFGASQQEKDFSEKSWEEVAKRMLTQPEDKRKALTYF
jgi:hypothetical protein